MKRLTLAGIAAGVLALGLTLGGVRTAAVAKPSSTPSPAPMPTATPVPPQVLIPQLEAQLKKNPNDRDAAVQLAGEFLTIGHPEAVVPITEQLLKNGDKTAQVYYIDGLAQEQLGNASQATADLQSASDLEPTNADVLAQLTQIYVKENDFPDAERVAQRSITFNKTQPGPYVQLGDVYAAEQKWDQARTQFEAAFKLDGKDVSPLLAEAQTYIDQNSDSNALAVVQRAIAADPKNIQVLIFRGDVYARMKEPQQAALAYDDAMDATTDPAVQAGIMVHKAQMYAAAGDQKNAQATFAAAESRYPKDSAVFTAYGEYWIGQKNERNAESQWLAALKVDKSDVNALLDLARLKVSQHRMTDAVGYLKQLTNVAPSAQSFAMLGQAEVSMRDYQGAKKACTQSFQIQQDPQTLACIAGSDFSMRDYKEAASIFDVLDGHVKPFMDHSPQLLYMAANSYERTNQNGKAVDAYRRLLKTLKPGSPPYKTTEAAIRKLQSRPKPAHKSAVRKK